MARGNNDSISDMEPSTDCDFSIGIFSNNSNYSTHHWFYQGGNSNSFGLRGLGFGPAASTTRTQVRMENKQMYLTKEIRGPHPGGICNSRTNEIEVN